MRSDLKAETLADELLFLTGKAIMEGDDALFMSCLNLPHIIETLKERYVIATAAQASEVLASVRRYMRDNDIVDLVRTVKSANFLDPETVSATHISLMVGKAGTPERSPYPVYTVMRNFDGAWKMTSSIYAILDSDQHTSALTPHEKGK